MTSRRGFLSSILAVAAAPAVVKTSSLMKLVPTESGILTYKVSGRYDINPDSLERMMIEIRESGTIRPTQLIVPAYMVNLARSMLQTKENVCAEILRASYE